MQAASIFRTVRWLAVLCFVFFAAHVVAGELPTAKPEDVGMSSDKLAKVDALLKQLIAEKKLAGSTLVVSRHGKVVHFQSEGLMDVEANKPMRNDAIVRIYSHTKAITTAAALMLCDDGKLSLDDPVAKHLPEIKGVQVQGQDGPAAPATEMTVRDLMLHTAGFSYGNSGVAAADKAYREANIFAPNTTLADMTAKLGRVPLSFDPGKEWGYSVSIDVLGRVVEVVSGQPLDEFFERRIFKPLDMHDTGFFVPAEKVDRFASVYTSDGKGTLTLKSLSPKDAPLPYEYLRRPSLLSGGGGLVSTARDYLRFLTMISRGGELDGVRLLSADTVRRMTTNQLSEQVGWIKFGGQPRTGVGFGLGFSVRVKMSEWDPQGRVGEYGWGGAASTHYWTSPKDDLIVVVLEQTVPYSFLTEFAVKGPIYDAIIGP